MWLSVGVLPPLLLHAQPYLILLYLALLYVSLPSSVSDISTLPTHLVLPDSDLWLSVGVLPPLLLHAQPYLILLYLALLYVSLPSSVADISTLPTLTWSYLILALCGLSVGVHSPLLLHARPYLPYLALPCLTLPISDISLTWSYLILALCGFCGCTSPAATARPVFPYLTLLYLVLFLISDISTLHLPGPT